jgi:hypothetical protein
MTARDTAAGASETIPATPKRAMKRIFIRRPPQPIPDALEEDKIPQAS